MTSQNKQHKNVNKKRSSLILSDVEARQDNAIIEDASPLIILNFKTR